MNLSNTLTCSRILLIPIVVLFLIEGSKSSNKIAALFFIIATFTDWLDGHLARRRNQTTTLGAILDPIADKLLIISALLPLVSLGRVDAWLAGIIIGREFLVTVLRAFAINEGNIMPAQMMGKCKMVLEVASITMLILNLFPVFARYLLILAMILAIISGIEYFRKSAKEIFQ
ncbi:MAG: CDP-diacylglycerol--glycerol-3-phosphate 3-phosphatidyltransferase [Nitrospinota bacterium]|nr:CDP-diacylglycerol--glycerol-3-phosphate 3-phosphatidyltransferase [Nitrospinota bacterium]